MHRRLIILIAWALTTTVVAGVSWFGIRSALGGTAPGSALPLSAGELRRAEPVTQGPAQSPAATSPAAAPSPTATTPPADTAAAAADSWAAAADERGLNGFRRTVRTVGGEAVVWSAKGDCRVLGTTPKAGFVVTTQAGGDAATVTFERPDVKVRATVTVRWVANAPYAEVAETIGFK